MQPAAAPSPAVAPTRCVTSPPGSPVFFFNFCDGCVFPGFPAPPGVRGARPLPCARRGWVRARAAARARPGAPPPRRRACALATLLAATPVLSPPRSPALLPVRRWCLAPRTIRGRRGGDVITAAAVSVPPLLPPPPVSVWRRRRLPGPTQPRRSARVVSPAPRPRTPLAPDHPRRPSPAGGPPADVRARAVGTLPARRWPLLAVTGRAWRFRTYWSVGRVAPGSPRRPARPAVRRATLSCTHLSVRTDSPRQSKE